MKKTWLNLLINLNPHFTTFYKPVSHNKPINTNFFYRKHFFKQIILFFSFHEINLFLSLLADIVLLL